MAEPSALDRRFELQSKRLQQKAKGQQQQQSDALKRRIATGPGLSSGAGLKIQNQAAEQQGKQLQDIREGVAVQKAGAEFQQEQIQKDRDFKSGQAKLGREFAAGQSQLGREFASIEARKGREFQSIEAGKQRGFSRELFDVEQKFKNKAFDFQKSQAGKQFDLAMKRFGMDEEAQAFNMEMADKIFDKPDMIEKGAMALGFGKTSPFSGMFSGGTGNNTGGSDFSSGGPGGFL